MPWKGTSFKPELFETKNPKRILKSSHQKKLVKTGMVNVLAWFLNNTYKFHFVSKIAGRMFLRINFFIDTTLPTFQPQINVVSTLCITVQITLIRRWKWNKIRSPNLNFAQYWYNVSVQRWSKVKSKLHNGNAIVFQRYTVSFQSCFNVDRTLSQRCFNVASTSIKAMSKVIWLVKSKNLQKDW